MTNMDSVNRAADGVVMPFRGKIFEGQGIQTVDVHVEHDGTIRVWDPIAGYYTLCHSITKQNQTAIRKVAELLQQRKAKRC